MIVLIQRVDHASVVVDQDTVGAIKKGLLAFVGVQPDDQVSQLNRAVEKLLSYRVFEDEDGKMNLSVRDIQGGLLMVPQFTLAADTKRGARPSFSTAASPEHGKVIFDAYVQLLKEKHALVETGRFGADMKITLLNNGPVTFLLSL